MAMKKVNLAGTLKISAGTWMSLVRSLSPKVEDVNFSDCELDDESAKVIGEAMVNLPALSTSFKMFMPVEGDPRFIIQLCLVVWWERCLWTLPIKPYIPSC